jgi:hypothetical protein
LRDKRYSKAKRMLTVEHLVVVAWSVAL